MARPDEYVELTRAEIAGSGLGTSPRGIAGYESLQEAAFNDNPEAAAAAAKAASDAANAASAAQAGANGAQQAAEAAQASADAVNAAKVDRDATPEWAAVAVAADRQARSYTAPTVSPTYDPQQAQEVASELQKLSRIVATLITDLRANRVLKP